MKYEMINEELRIASCSLADLTLEQVKHFLGQWEPGSNIRQSYLNSMKKRMT